MLLNAGMLVLVQGTSNTNNQKSELRALYLMVAGQLKLHHPSWCLYLKKFTEPEPNTQNPMPDEDVAGADPRTVAVTSVARSVRSRQTTQKVD